jgi:hypothetical protein
MSDSTRTSSGEIVGSFKDQKKIRRIFLEVLLGENAIKGNPKAKAETL